MLKRSRDRKVTTAVSPNGKTALVGNAFGLPSGKGFSCPGATSVCERICYAGKLEKIYSGVRNVLMHNWNLLKDADFDTMVSLIDAMIDDFRAESVKCNAPLAFRIHWDGDFFSAEYAHAWRTVIEDNPDILFWVYTRSFTPALNVIPVIAGTPNLSIYLSVDADNAEYSEAIVNRYPGIRLAALGQTFDEARESLIGDRKTYNCPEIDRRIPLISEKGSACIRCNVCVKGRGDVVFSISKK